MSPPPTSSDPPAGLEHARWFAESVQPHEPALRAYLKRKYPTLPDVDDVVQESFLKTFLARKMGRLTSTRGFLFHVARNAAVTCFRRRRFLVSAPVSDHAACGVMSSGADVVENVCARDELDLVADAVAGLPGRCREIVTLRLAEGLDYPEIARRLDVSEATVRVQVARGMRKCADFMRRHGVYREEAS